MIDYRVEVWDWTRKGWIPIKDFIEDRAKKNSIGLDADEGLTLMQAHVRVIQLAKKYPYLRFRANRMPV
ncbi:hypothetical protein [Spirosoma aerophilum]